MQTVRINIQESYLPRLKAFLKSLPKEALAQNSLDDEILSRVDEYKSGNMTTTPLLDGLDRIRAKIKAKI
jgi:hypothetical protein